MQLEPLGRFRFAAQAACRSEYSPQLKRCSEKDADSSGYGVPRIEDTNSVGDSALQKAFSGFPNLSMTKPVSKLSPYGMKSVLAFVSFVDYGSS
jgi:hypothetical protein